MNLVELVAGLDALNAFGPDVSRKRLWRFFGKAFSIDLEGAERSLTQLKNRKIEPAKFSDMLKSTVLTLIDRSSM